MKKILVISTTVFVYSITLCSAADTIDMMVNKIKEPRKGIELKELSTIPDPFVAVKKDINVTEVIKPKKKISLVLGGIMNHTAYINGQWHKEGDEISGFILRYVGTKGVVLVDEEHIKRLFLHEKKDGIIKMEEDEK